LTTCSSSVTSTAGNTLEGIKDEYVDWMGLSYFARGRLRQPPLELLTFARKRGKPVMIAEATPQRYKTSALTFSYDGANPMEKTADEIWSDFWLNASPDLFEILGY
jgi:hypothetical protein